MQRYQTTPTAVAMTTSHARLRHEAVLSAMENGGNSVTLCDRLLAPSVNVSVKLNTTYIYANVVLPGFTLLFTCPGTTGGN